MWDGRLIPRGVVLTKYQPQGNEPFYRVVEGKYLDPVQSQGKHHILVDVLDEHGERMIGVNVHLMNGGDAIQVTEAKPGEPYATSFGMYAAGYGYSVKVDDQSDVVSRMGLGDIENPFAGEHVSFAFTFQRASSNIAPPPPPQPPPHNSDIAADLQALRVQYANGLVMLDAIIAKEGR